MKNDNFFATRYRDGFLFNNKYEVFIEQQVTEEGRLADLYNASVYEANGKMLESFDGYNTPNDAKEAAKNFIQNRS